MVAGLAIKPSMFKGETPVLSPSWVSNGRWAVEKTLAGPGLHGWLKSKDTLELWLGKVNRSVVREYETDARLEEMWDAATAPGKGGGEVWEVTGWQSTLGQYRKLWTRLLQHESGVGTVPEHMAELLEMYTGQKLLGPKPTKGLLESAVAFGEPGARWMLMPMRMRLSELPKPLVIPVLEVE